MNKQSEKASKPKEVGFDKDVEVDLRYVRVWSSVLFAVLNCCFVKRVVRDIIEVESLVKLVVEIFLVVLFSSKEMNV